MRLAAAVILVCLLALKCDGFLVGRQKIRIGYRRQHRGERGDDGAIVASSFSSLAQNNTTEESSLPLSPDPINSKDTTDFQKIRRTLPPRIQYWLRDSGILRWIVDSVGSLLMAREVLRQHPEAVEEFLHLSDASSLTWKLTGRRRLTKQFLQSPTAPSNILSLRIASETISYGVSSQQRIQLMKPIGTTKHDKLVVFVHGGAWGSGFPALYRLSAKPFLQAGWSVAVLGYRTYPTADCTGQVQDVAEAIERLLSDRSSCYSDVTVVGHSSGAHVCALGLVGGIIAPRKVDRFVGISGVYDIPSHYQFEKIRGVERLSPLSQACGGSVHQWRQHSPTYMVNQRKQRQSRAGVDLAWLPRTLLVHGELDSTVPCSSSANFARALDESSHYHGNNCDLRILPKVEHAETVLHVMFGGPTGDTILDWMIRTEVQPSKGET